MVCFTTFTFGSTFASYGSDILSIVLFLQNFLNGNIFNSEEQIILTVEEFFEYKPTEHYTDGVQKLPEGWEKIIKNKGEYILI